MDNLSQQSNYSGKFSEIYDLFYSQKTYTQEVDFIQTLLMRYGDSPQQKILELGCGTGTHSFLLEKYGHEIVGIDLSSDMINKAIKKAKNLNSKVRFFTQDMLELDQTDRPFDAVICLFDSICYVTENTDFASLLNKVFTRLKPGGLFIFEFWNAAAMIKHLDPIRISRLQIGEDSFIKISEAQLDYKQQLYKVNYTLYEVKADGYCNTYTEQHINRHYQVQEMAYFLSQAGLIPLKWYAGYANDETIRGSTWNILCVAQT